MSEPLIVVIPHRLGKDEALREIKAGIGRAKSEFAWLLSLEEEVWTDDRLKFPRCGAWSTSFRFSSTYTRQAFVLKSHCHGSLRVSLKRHNASLARRAT